jgi:hypothetical protein
MFAGDAGVDVARRPVAPAQHRCYRVPGGGIYMYDVLMIAIGCGFFFAAVLYALACEKM